MVAGDEAGQRLHPAILVQRVDLGIGTLIRDVFLDEQMAVCQRSDLGRVGDAKDLMTLGTLAQHLTDAAGRLAGNAAVDLVVDDGRHRVLVGHRVLDGEGDTAQLAA